MTDKPNHRFADWLSSVSSRASNTRLSNRRPPGIALNNPRKTTVDDIGRTRAIDCGICLKSLEYNPKLCEDCQIWNDATHVFRCLQGEWLPRATFKEIQEREECMMCQEVAKAILNRFPLEDEYVRELFPNVEVRNYGPYCLGDTGLGALDPRLSGTNSESFLFDDRKSTRQNSEKRMQVVVYLVLSAPVGSKLRDKFPELDGYETVGGKEIPVLGSFRTEPQFGPPGLCQPTIGLQLELLYANSTAQLVSLERWEKPFIDNDLVTKWISSCQEHHGAACEPKNSPLIPPGFKAIDTLRMCIVELASEPTPTYTALSYTWGATSGVPELQLERANYTELMQDGALTQAEGIPLVIRDTITLCQTLKQRYLWVDRLCIIQDDSASKLAQIQAMDQIYHSASFTIVAATPLGAGLPGVTNHPRKSSLRNHTRRFSRNFRFIADNFKTTVIQSFWNTRGWTYQERLLSRRAIYITEFDAYFICKKGAEQEDIGEFAATINPWDFSAPSQYFVTVADYTVRNLSFRSDILNAFAGVGNVFAREMGTELIYGLPEKYLPQALLWVSSSETEMSAETPGIPSWAWAAWKGQTVYDLNARVDKIKVGPLVRFYFQDPVRGLLRVQTSRVWFFKEVDFKECQTLPVVDVDYPEMRFMPDGGESDRVWTECPQNPWLIPSQNPEEFFLQKASKYPGSLVFRTTIATVRLQRQQRGSEEDMQSLDILDKNNATVGQTGRLHHTQIANILSSDTSHEVIVLAAGILAESDRYAMTHSVLDVSGVMRDPEIGKTPWYLHVLLIQRDVDGVARRAGIGAVETASWKRCEPEWCTVILV